MAEVGALAAVMSNPEGFANAVKTVSESVGTTIEGVGKVVDVLQKAKGLVSCFVKFCFYNLTLLIYLDLF